MGLVAVYLDEDQQELVRQLVEAELELSYTEQEPLSDEAQNYRLLLTDTLDEIIMGAKVE